MVALKGKAILAALGKRDPSYSAYLVYGPDQGLVRERTSKLSQMVIDDPHDPFSFMELSDTDLKAEPGRLSDEITALSFIGGERVIRVRMNSEAQASAVTNFITALDNDHLKPNGIVLVEGGDLGPRSTLRKAFQKAKRAASLPCYEDAPAAVRSLAAEMARDHGLSIEPDAMTFLTSTLGEDRGITRSEIEKLLFFKSAGTNNQNTGDKSGSVISLADARLCLVDAASDTLNDVASHCQDGRTGPLADALHRSATAGTSSIALLRALQRAFGRLMEAQAHIAKGANANDAMKKLRPPVFFAEQDAFRTRLNQWSLPRLTLARRWLIEAELEAKTTGNPQRELVERVALRLARIPSARR